MALSWPASLCPSEMTWGVVNNSRAFTSTLSNSQEIVAFPGAYWQCTLTFENLNRSKERDLSSFLGKLDGMFGTFNLPAFTRRRTDSVGALTVVSGNAQSRSILVAGAVSRKVIFSAGDYLTVAGEMFEVVDATTSDAQGRATVQVNKRIRRALVAGTTVEYLNPYSEMRMTQDTWNMTVRPVVANGSYQFREAF